MRMGGEWEKEGGRREVVGVVKGRKGVRENEGGQGVGRRNRGVGRRKAW